MPPSRCTYHTGLVICLLGVSFISPAAEGATLRDARPLMGTVVEVVAEAPEQAAVERAVHEAYAEMQRLSAMMNHYDAASVVSAINAAAGERAVKAPGELLEVLGQAQRLAERTAGAFDITVGAMQGWRFRMDDPRIPPPQELAGQRSKVNYRKLHIDGRRHTVSLAERGMRIDLGGIAKVYILEAGRRVLESRGVARALVNGGGDVVVHGGNAPRPWRVGIRDPREPQKLLGALEVHRGCVASSGDYERFFVRDGRRYHHILDPRTGQPARGVRGVTLLAADGAAVNGLSVAIMVLGSAAGKKLVADTPGVEALIVDAEGSVWMSEGFRARFTP